ncbi:MAG: porin family protein [Bacteroidales bacterium]|nr:porin family protein [Bacteroidales bacterium]
MKALKSLLAAIAIALLALPIQAQHRGETSLGVRGGWNTRNHSPMAGIFFQYQFSEHFRLSPNIDYIFEHHDQDGAAVNINAHFPFIVSQNQKWCLYPLAGLTYSTWSRKHVHDTLDDTNDVTTRDSRIGLNLGGGIELRCTESLKLNFEAKAALVKRYSTGAFNIGIAYIF